MLRFSMKTKKVSFSFCAEMNFTEPELVRNIMSFVLKCFCNYGIKVTFHAVSIFLIIMDFYPESVETSCVDFDNITELKVEKEDTEFIMKEEILEISDADDKQFLYRYKQVSCGRAFSAEYALHLDEVICYDEKNLTCDICKETFKDKHTLQMHKYLHQELSSKKKYSCPYDSCPRYYYVKRSFDSHVKSHEGKKFECTYPGCGKKLSRQETLNKHMLVHRRNELMLNKTTGSAVPEFMCYICKRNFETKINLERHMSDHQNLSEKTFACGNYEEHLNNETNRQEHVCCDSGFPCDVCKTSSITISNVQSHISVHQREDFFCDVCKRRLQTKEDLERHMFLHEGKMFSCNKCEKVLTRKSHLRRHMLLHEDKVPCTICKQMKTKEQLKTHMFVHQKENFYCDLCKRYFKAKEDLEKHMFLHEGKGFPCSMCDKVFKRKDSVQRHMFLHTGVKVPCDICKKMLTEKQLQFHMSRHLKEFPCNVCNRIFRSKGNLLRHVYLHNGEVFTCDICKKILQTKEQMQAHTALHQVKKFTCDICKELFSTLRNRHRHMSLHKQEEFIGNTGNNLLRTNEHMPYQKRVYTCVKCKINFTTKIRMQKHVCLQAETSPHVMYQERFTDKAEDQRCITDQKEPSTNETFHCHICNRCFESESVMQKHICLHHESLEKEGYVCDICNRLFKTERGLKKHSSFHEDLSRRKKFFCTYSNCSKGYVYHRNLTYHVKHDHEGKECTYVDCGEEPASEVGAASTVAAEEWQERKEGMQTHGENALSSLTTSSQKYEHGRKWLLENKNMLHESLKLKSQQYTGESDKVWKNVKILIEPLYIQRNGHIARESPWSTETRVQKLNDSNLYVSENFLSCGNDHIEQCFELKEETESTNIEQQEVNSSSNFSDCRTSTHSGCTGYIDSHKVSQVEVKITYGMISITFMILVFILKTHVVWDISDTIYWLFFWLARI